MLLLSSRHLADAVLMRNQCFVHAARTKFPDNKAWLAGVFLRRKRPPSARPSAEMSFRGAREVPTKVWVRETGGPCHNRWIFGKSHERTSSRHLG